MCSCGVLLRNCDDADPSCKCNIPQWSFPSSYNKMTHLFHAFLFVYEYATILTVVPIIVDAKIFESFITSRCYKQTMQLSEILAYPSGDIPPLRGRSLLRLSSPHLDRYRCLQDPRPFFTVTFPRRRGSVFMVYRFF